MCARDIIDEKNIKTVEKILESYPKEIKKYIDSMSSKTSYTKMVYSRYIINFLNYIKKECNLDINIINNYKKIKPMNIDSYMENIRYKKNGEEKSATFRAANLAALKGFFKFLLINDIIESNPCQYTEIPKDNKEHDIITISDNDYNIMINNIKNGVGNERAKSLQQKWINRDIAILTLGITTGLRISAIVGIDLNDINLLEKYIIVTEKGNIQKKIYIGDKTIDSIKKWLIDRRRLNISDDESALFIGRGNSRISVRAIENRFKAISKSTGKAITPHKMRATCATRLYELTGDIYSVQNQLGHKNIKNTQRYAKISDERKIEISTILDNIF